MNGPIAIVHNWSEGLNLVVAFLIGIGFGFFLEQGGFGNSRKLALQFYFRDMTVFKVMFTAIITAMAGLIFFSAFGWIDMELVSLNPTYAWSGIVGGLVMGVGFAVGGYCPGTGIVGLATLKTDALFYLAGILGGIFIFGEAESWLHHFFYSGFWGDRLTLPQVLGIPAGVVGFAVIVMALLCFWGAELLEKKFARTEEEQ